MTKCISMGFLLQSRQSVCCIQRAAIDVIKIVLIIRRKPFCSGNKILAAFLPASQRGTVRMDDQITVLRVEIAKPMRNNAVDDPSCNGFRNALSRAYIRRYKHWSFLRSP